MEKPSYVYSTQIRETHIDSFGHVNNAMYLQLFEEARWDMITAGGYGLAVAKQRKQGPVILEANVKFRKELLNREKIRIENVNLAMRGKILTLQQTLFKESGEASAIAVFLVGFLDLQARKLVEPPALWLTAIGWKPAL